jgi:hypothetical protein
MYLPCESNVGDSPAREDKFLFPNGLAAGGVIGLGLSHSERFPYLESQNLPVHEVKDQYKRKDLEKLESKGVNILITNASQRRGRAAVAVTSQDSGGLDDDLARARRACQEDATK